MVQSARLLGAGDLAAAAMRHALIACASICCCKHGRLVRRCTHACCRQHKRDYSPLQMGLLLQHAWCLWQGMLLLLQHAWTLLQWHLLLLQHAWDLL